MLTKPRHFGAWTFTVCSSREDDAGSTPDGQHATCRRSRRTLPGGAGSAHRREGHAGGALMIVPVAAKAPREGAVARNPGQGAARLFNRELSWLDFDQRVLEVAADAHMPLLERVKLCGIVGSNL